MSRMSILAIILGAIAPGIPLKSSIITIKNTSPKNWYVKILFLKSDPNPSLPAGSSEIMGEKQSFDKNTVLEFAKNINRKAVNASLPFTSLAGTSVSITAKPYDVGYVQFSDTLPLDGRTSPSKNTLFSINFDFETNLTDLRQITITINNDNIIIEEIGANQRIIHLTGPNAYNTTMYYIK